MNASAAILGRYNGRAVNTATWEHEHVAVYLVDSWELDVGGVIRNVHESGIDHLVVDCVLGSRSHTTGTGIQIIDEQTAHLSLHPTAAIRRSEGQKYPVEAWIPDCALQGGVALCSKWREFASTDQDVNVLMSCMKGCGVANEHYS